MGFPSPSLAGKSPHWSSMSRLRFCFHLDTFYGNALLFFLSILKHSNDRLLKLLPPQLSHPVETTPRHINANLLIKRLLSTAIVGRRKKKRLLSSSSRWSLGNRERDEKKKLTWMKVPAS